MIIHALIICAFSAVAALATEGVSWLLVYRKPEYKRLKKQIEKNHQIIEKLKREGKDEKRRQKMQKELQKDNTMLSGMKIYGMIFLSIVMLVLYQLLKQYYNGIVVAKLPFLPISLFRKLTHSGLETEDFTDCSMGFIYALSTLAIRANLLRVIGDNAPRGAGTLFDQLKQLDAPKEE